LPDYRRLSISHGRKFKSAYDHTNAESMMVGGEQLQMTEEITSDG
jgi:hypothetical protein